MRRASSLHAPYQQATGDYGSWDARRAFGGVTKQVMQAQDPVAAVQATQLAIKHAMAGQPGPVAVLFSHDALAGTVAPDSQPALYPTRFYLPPPPPPAEPALIAAAAERMLAARAAGRSSPATACASPRPTSELRDWPRRPGCRWRRPPPARAAFPKRIRWRSACSAPSAPPAANACLGEADLVLVVGSKLSPSDTAWENTQAARSDAADFHPDRYRAAQRLVELPGRDRWCSAMRRGSSVQLGEAVRSRGGRAPRGGESPRRAASRGARLFQRAGLYAPTTSRSCRSG